MNKRASGVSSMTHLCQVYLLMNLQIGSDTHLTEGNYFERLFCPTSCNMKMKMKNYFLVFLAVVLLAWGLSEHVLHATSPSQITVKGHIRGAIV